MKYYSVYIEDVEDKFFTYSSKKEVYTPGEWVRVRFNGKEKHGLIIKEEKNLEYNYKISEIFERAEASPAIPEKLLDLYMWVSDYYLSSLKDVITFAYPKKLKGKYKETIEQVKLFIPLNEVEKNIADYFSKTKEVSPITLTKKFGKENILNLLERGILKKKKVVAETKTRNTAKYKHAAYEERVVKLTDEQKKAKETIVNSKKRNSLLYGVTGSGKTEIYIELIKDALDKGYGSIFLVPEISLTPQMKDRFASVFGDKIAILHSRMTDAERVNEWKNVYYGDKQIVLGVRSAVFAPVKNLKYIIIDEEHESTYKQDISPRYNAKFVAIKRGENENLKVVFGSATPSIENFYYAKEGIFEFIRLSSRYAESEKAEIKVVNMKNEKDGNWSGVLLESILKRLREKEQSLLFLNRKGYSNFVQCKDCGHIEKCPHCSVSYIYYKTANMMKCSYCGKSKIFTHKCTKCGSKNINYQGTGTEKLEHELMHYFNGVRVLRVDSDTVKERDSYEVIYRDFMDRKYDILLGTQIIAKGFHFPDITLAGIISADSILNFPDFRSGEKTFQLIVQASGRAGRGDKRGEVIIQTYTPENYVIKHSVTGDYDKFYEEEIEFRKVLNYPPYGKIINIVISSENEKGLEEKSVEFFNKIKTEGLEMFGPFEAPIYRIKNRFRYQIFIKGDREKVNSLKTNIKEILTHENNEEIRIAVDVDPINLM